VEPCNNFSSIDSITCMNLNIPRSFELPSFSGKRTNYEEVSQRSGFAGQERGSAKPLFPSCMMAHRISKDRRAFPDTMTACWNTGLGRLCSKPIYMSTDL